MNYETIVGLEIHVELNTETKAYCSCANTFGAEVNTLTCPGCAGLPGTIPTLNEKVVEKAVCAGIAMNSKINEFSKQDRKNYFYPDTAKAYQISQFDIPICEGGYLEFIADDKGTMKKVRLNRIQAEEDAGKLLHNDSFEGTLIDLNRSGVPLIEIVTEPDIRTPEEAKVFLETLHATLVAIGVTDGKMQEGSMRCDVNVSVNPVGSDTYGTRVEMKNVNSFSGAARAIAYESDRQIQLLESGQKIDQETRRWDDAAGDNKILRTKESANDYRYFPDPDLKTIHVTNELIESLTANMPELPHYKTVRYMKDYQIPLFDANLLIENQDKGDFFVQCAKLKKVSNTALSNWLLGDITRSLNDHKTTLAESKLTPEKLVEMIVLIESKTISNAAGKLIIDELLYLDKNAAEIVAEKNLAQITDTTALKTLAETVLANHPDTIEQYKAGKTNVIGFLVGQAMKLSKGQGNPAVLKELLLELIG